jgi:uncharacterized protein (DUF433 family)
MDAVREAEKLVQQMSQAEKAELLRLLVAELDDDALGIESDPDVAGGEARIVRTRIPVWVLEQARRLGASESELLEAYPTLHANDLQHAWAYASAHQAEIDQQIKDNEAA